MPAFHRANTGCWLLGGVWLLTLGAAPVSVTVRLPRTTTKSSAKIVLHLDELQLPPHSSGIVRVFADLPTADTATDTADEHFLGYFTLVAHNSAAAARGLHRSRVTLDISHKKALLADRKAVTITLVPLGGTSDAPSQTPDKPTVGRAYVVQE
jgi:hypothetical protein